MTTQHTPISKRDIFGIDDRNLDKYSHSELHDGKLNLLGKVYNPDIAAFIVKACNTHYDLEAALNAISDLYAEKGDARLLLAQAADIADEALELIEKAKQ